MKTKKKQKIASCGKAYGCPVVLLQIYDSTLSVEDLKLLNMALAKDLQTGKPQVITVPPSMQINITHVGRMRGIKTETLGAGSYQIKLYSNQDESETIIKPASSIVGIDGQPIKTE